MSKKQEFEKGAIVKLKSGGPDMTVRSIEINMTTGKLGVEFQ